MDERLLSASEFGGEIEVQKNLRPKTLSEYIGQDRLKEKMEIFMTASKNRGESMDHTLLYGPPGLGKTTLAGVIATEMGTNLKVTSGPVLDKAGDLAAILTSLEEQDILFIDEIHRLNTSVEEILYPAMEDREIDIIIGKGPTARSIRIELPSFTLIGATTRAGLPRIANRFLKRVRDYAEIRGDGIITLKIAKEALNLLGVDDYGLDELDREIILSIIDNYGGGPVGIETLALLLGEDRRTLEEIYEPYLVKIGFIKRTHRGRVVTSKAYKHFNKKRKTEGNL
ncbi:MAG: Holliday junction branch migration DNA helicase RuvB [Fusobacteriia bacterium 4572_74]|nr:MAG: Holliday junction branch migration DNA helicase RuvB [Fusobacteriia bacterium 4572_74]